MQSENENERNLVERTARGGIVVSVYKIRPGEYVAQAFLSRDKKYLTSYGENVNVVKNRIWTEINLNRKIG